MWKKLCSIFICVMMLSTTIPTAFAANPSDMQAKLSSIENAVYGSNQTAPLLDRVSRIERDFGTQNPNFSIVERVDSLYALIYDNSNGPSIITQLNAVEWTISREINTATIQKRIGDLEMLFEGKQLEGSFLYRIDKIAGHAYGSNPIPLMQIGIPANTLVKIALTNPLNAKELRDGDIIEYTAAEDIISSGMLIFAKGTQGYGRVLDVRTAKNFGRDAKIEIDFEALTSIDGSSVSMLLGNESKEMMENMAMAAGASIAGMAVLGPIGVIGGAFVKGKNIDLPAGTELFIQTKNDITLYGLETDLPDNAIIAPATTDEEENYKEEVPADEMLPAES